MDYKGRLKRARDEMRKRNIEMMFLDYGANLWYLTGVHRRQPQLTDSNAYGDYLCGAYISVDDEIILVAPRMGGSFFQREAEKIPWITDVRIINEQETPNDVLSEIVERYHLKGKRISLDDRAWMQTGLLFQHMILNCRISFASDIITPMRMIKDDEEVKVMQKAGQITDDVYEETISFLKLGVTEFEVAHEIDLQFAKRGADHPSFVTGVRFTKPGKSQNMGASRTTDRKLEDGDSITFDFGTCYQGYCSDFGRTAFAGDPPKEVKKIHEIVMSAQANAIEKMVSGTITATQLDNVARNIIRKAGYGQGFTHRLGHGIGVTVHEPPFLYPPDDTLLVSGMTFTIEPSIRLLDSYGCRVEDVVMVTEKGGIPFSNFHKELTVR